VKWYETKDFKRLQKEWYERLKSSGFDDHEKLTAQGLVLKQTSHNRKADRKPFLVKEAIADYFRVFAECAANYRFESQIDQLVINYYVAGHRLCDIKAHLEEAGIKRCRTTIFYIIKKYEAKWGIK